jgi:hypothetical protein
MFSPAVRAIALLNKDKLVEYYCKEILAAIAPRLPNRAS